jgi:hypothetical protein
MHHQQGQVNTRIQSLSALQAPHSHALINPDAAEVEAALEECCKTMGIWQSHFQDYNTMSAYLFPYATDERLFAIGLYNGLLYFIDDIFDRHDKQKAQSSYALEDLFKHAVEIFLTGVTPNQKHPILQTAYLLHREFERLAPSETWMQRFARNSIHHLQSSLSGVAANTQMKRYNSWYEEYVEVRDLDSGMAPTIDLIEFALGRNLSSEIYANPMLRKARLYVTRYCALSNDLFSYDKEVVQHASNFNAVAILQRDGLSFETAIAKLITNLNEMVEAFDALPFDTLDTDGQIYAHCLWQQLVAAYYWQFATNRYRSPNSSFAELRQFISTNRGAN